jgi:hypothetical protein
MHKTYAEKDRELAEFEVAAGLLNKLLLHTPDAAPKVRTLYRGGKPHGSISKRLHHFVPMYDYYDAEDPNSLSTLIEFGIAEVLTARYLFADDDSHLGNYGVCSTIKFFDKTLDGLLGNIAKKITQEKLLNFQEKVKEKYFFYKRKIEADKELTEEELADKATIDQLYSDDPEQALTNVKKCFTVATIDFDMHFWPIASKRKGERSPVEKAVRKISKPAEDSFPLSREDLQNFPAVKSMAAYYWPTAAFSSNAVSELLKQVSQTSFIATELTKKIYRDDHASSFSKLADKEAFKRHKYTTLLKCILIPPTMFASIAHVSFERPETQQEFINFMLARQKYLRDVLLSTLEFQQFFAMNMDELKKDILKEFYTFSDSLNLKDPPNIHYAPLSFKHEAFLPSHFNLEYPRVWRDCHQHQIAWQLQHITEIRAHHKEKLGEYLSNLDSFYEALNKESLDFFLKENISLDDTVLYAKKMLKLIEEFNEQVHGISAKLANTDDQESWVSSIVRLQETCNFIVSKDPEHAQNSSYSGNSVPQSSYYSPGHRHVETSRLLRGDGYLYNLIQDGQQTLASWFCDPMHLDVVRQITLMSCKEYSATSWGGLRSYWDSGAAIKQESITKLKNKLESQKPIVALEIIDSLINLLNGPGGWEINSFNTCFMMRFYKAFGAYFNGLSPVVRRAVDPSLFRVFDYTDGDRRCIAEEMLNKVVLQPMRDALVKGLKKQRTELLSQKDTVHSGKRTSPLLRTMIK